MKIALVVPARRWSCNFIAEGFLRYVNRPEYEFKIVPSWGRLPESLVDYDWIFSLFLWRQSDYMSKTFKRIRHKFTGYLTGRFCYLRIGDWSVFPHIFAVSDAVVVKHKLNTEYSVLPFGVDTELFYPMGLEKTYFTAYIGNAAGRSRQKRVQSWFIPICKKAGVSYYIHDPVRGTSLFLTLDQIALKYNELQAHLMTSSWDGAPRPTLEAASCGLPILSTRTGFPAMGLVEDGVNGYFCDTKRDFIDRIHEWQQDPIKMVEMGARSREIVLREWDWRIVAEKWMRKLEELW